MGFEDKVSNKAEDVTGKAKEGVGKVTDDEALETEGRNDQRKSALKDAGEKIKDVFRK